MFNFNLGIAKSFGSERETSSAPSGPMPGGMGGGPAWGFGGGGGMMGGGNESGRFNVQLSAQIYEPVQSRRDYGQYSGVLSSPC
ncbi:MAG: hypothetical protein U0Y68_25235 [Blastocatellia bacterium]